MVRFIREISSTVDGYNNIWTLLCAGLISSCISACQIVDADKFHHHTCTMTLYFNFTPLWLTTRKLGLVSPVRRVEPHISP